jgi:hypothetical protein
VPAPRTQEESDKSLPRILTDILDGIGRMFLLHKRHSLRPDSCAFLSLAAAGGAESPEPTLPTLWIIYLGQKVSREGVLGASIGS